MVSLGAWFADPAASVYLQVSMSIPTEIASSRKLLSPGNMERDESWSEEGVDLDGLRYVEVNLGGTI
jgi:hypothetical protein